MPHDDHDLGLSHDLPRLISRRRALGVLLGGFGSAVVVACGGTSSQDRSTAAGGDQIPEETAGPFPGDGSNGPNVLSESGIVRSDITRSVGDASGVAEGVPTTVNLKLLDVTGGGGPLAGAAVYLWHCDREGRYSLYDDAVAGENYLRGVQESGADGTLTFTTIFPAAYQGRWPHMHFEIYESLDAATAGQAKLRTTQLAIPQDVCEAVYATAGYERSVQNLAATSLDDDMVFGDGYRSQLASVSGSVEDGYTLTLNVGV
ncbi:protocatechuate 3,4-dioxygenase beta subunit [Solirubrobacter pauli]|uniref:Protocatechuate 3,4-dioxygenase beta subunit n=1 Tax=Solirubrobacter pauli TaxID=166793 RepID=A0A660L398_9ACTN|nr:3,4-dioxygenase subunit beta [Solirubrobacter pauli]RKQ87795.1 protocatechuate 3,4-dioxygenase beta subunit [Solirubrobacter pauli]